MIELGLGQLDINKSNMEPYILRQKNLRWYEKIVTAKSGKKTRKTKKIHTVASSNDRDTFSSEDKALQ